MKRYHRDLLRLCERAGADVVGLEQGAHIKMRLRRPDGATRLFVAPSSPGDGCRGDLNLRAEIVRWMRTPS